MDIGDFASWYFFRRLKKERLGRVATTIVRAWANNKWIVRVREQVVELATFLNHLWVLVESMENGTWLHYGCILSLCDCNRIYCVIKLFIFERMEACPTPFIHQELMDIRHFWTRKLSERSIFLQGVTSEFMAIEFFIFLSILSMNQIAVNPWICMEEVGNGMDFEIPTCLLLYNKFFLLAEIYKRYETYNQAYGDIVSRFTTYTITILSCKKKKL